ncbi:DNA primase [Luteolibacter flavescens]|uniref:DNA primase n=1 Tax=Luteolibacter flavescens TaxID=1859460 RepID=A0ABT3FM51_9BACT|nr:DNA primase [Luteolibacter flavescens]MCW1884643.1 DNA primase [Luteolibacter flavescens]
MSQISQETKEQILAATDIVALIESYIPVKRAGATYKALCPFHNEKTPSFNINPVRQSFHCFGCKKGGDAITFVREIENLTYPDAIKKLAARVGITVQEEVSSPEEDRARRQRGRLLDLHRETCEFLHQMLFTEEATHAREYLKSRGFGKEMAVRWQIGWMPENPEVFLKWARTKNYKRGEWIEAGIFGQSERGGVFVRFRDRLMFPIRNEHADVIAFSGRQLRHDPNSGKYINSPETPVFKKSNVLFALERARKAILKEGSVLLCEGQIDAIACHEQGITQAIAPLGTAFTPHHAKLLRRYAKRALLCFDADKAGFTAADRAYRELAAENISVRVVRMPAGEDPDSFMQKHGADAFRELLAEAADFFDFKIDQATAAGQLHDLQDRLAFEKECISLLSMMPDAVVREGIIQHVGTRLRAGTIELQNAVNRAARASKAKPRNADRDAPAEPEVPVVQGMPIDPTVAYLCGIALHSAVGQEWLAEQYETLHEAAEFIEGISLLEEILSARPDPTSHVAVNGFISGLTEPQRLALTSNPEFHNDPPEDVLPATETALSEVCSNALLRRDASLQARMSRPGISMGELSRLLNETKLVAELLKGVKQRFVFTERFAPNRKPPPKQFPRKSH